MKKGVWNHTPSKHSKRSRHEKPQSLNCLTTANEKHTTVFCAGLLIMIT